MRGHLEYADIDLSGSVGFDDLLLLLSDWS